MPAVTQRIDNYLGGVSRQSDDKKRPGQVRECLNAYPDPTFGLTKRPGLKWIHTMGTGTTYDSARWFYIHRDSDEKYIGCIIPSSLTITNNGSGLGSDTTYTNVPLKTTSGVGTGMTVDVTNVGGVVSTMVLNTPGKGYLDQDTFTLDKDKTGGLSVDPAGRLNLGDIKIWNAADGTECTVYFDAKDDVAWQASTLYEVGDYVTNDSGKLYKCTRKGMSNSSGGPTGTNSNIEYLTLWAVNTNYSVNDKRVSNGNVYKCDQAGYSDRRGQTGYPGIVGSGPTGTEADTIDPPDLAAWSASSPYAVNDYVRNDNGKVYLCTASSGNSASSGGPTGTGSSISDGSITWDYKHNYARWDYQDGSNGAARWDYVPRPARTYLQGLRANLNTLTVQDTSIITNDSWTIATQADPTFVAKSQATLIFNGVLTSSAFNVQITVDGLPYNMLEYTSSSTASYTDIINAIGHRIDRLGHGPPQTTAHTSAAESLLSGFSARTEYQTTIQLKSTKSFDINARGGLSTLLLTSFQDQVANVSQLPAESEHDHVVKIVNTASSNDSYFAKFVADNAVSGTGHWMETRDPSLSVGLDPATMPHELVNSEKNKFIFRPITWTERLVGDDTTNEHPSFVGKKIKQAFFHKNRLGFLSDDNVSMSRSGEFYNFYHKSAQTQTAADPVDLSCATVRPAVLHGVLPTPQGLVLFSKNQQFLMSAAEGLLTPTTTTINAISNYEMATDIAPVDMGTNVNFISKTPNYSRVFGMKTYGQEENPIIQDVGRVVNEWIPETIDTLTGSPQNQVIALSSQSSDTAYFYRTYADGQKLLVQAWFRWQLPGDVQFIVMDSDEMFMVTKQSSQITLSKANLSQSPDDAILVTSTGDKVNPCMDLYATALTVKYDSTNKFSKCYVPWDNVSTLTPVILVKGITTTGQYTESGVTYTPSAVATETTAWQGSTAYAVGDIVINGGKVYVCDNAGTSHASGGPTETNTIAGSITDGTVKWHYTVTSSTLTYFKVVGRDLTDDKANIYVGWKYDLDVTLPKTYFYDRNKDTDYTAPVTIARMKFALGLSGVMSFKLKSTGRLPASKSYTADGTTTVFKWFKDEIPYVDKDQIKVKINNVESTAFTAGDDQITLTAASSELKALSGNGSLTTFDLTYTPRDVSKVRVTIGGVATTAFNIVKNFINFDSAPASGSSNILVYSADDILVYLDEWYNLNPTVDYNTYLSNDTSVASESIVTIPIHQKSDNFQLRIWNDSPFPVALNSMMWEGNYSPRFYRRT